MKEQKFEKIVEDDGNFNGCLIGTIASIIGSFVIFLAWGDSIVTGMAIFIILVIVFFGWGSYMKSRKVYWRKIK